MRMIAEFCKEGEARYISHLDLMRVVQRSLRRASLPVDYSQGFNPHALLSFATAVPVGCSSACEIMDVKLNNDVLPDDFCDAINRALPAGMRVLRALCAKDEAPAPMAAVQAARYTIALCGLWADAVRDFLAADQRLAMKKSKKGMREVDIRPMVYELSAEEKNGETELACILRHDSALALKPSLLVEALGTQGEQAHRTALLIKRGEAWAPLYSLYEEGCA